MILPYDKAKFCQEVKNSDSFKNAPLSSHNPKTNKKYFFVEF